MTATDLDDTPITDPDTLPGFTEHNGIRVSPVGDEGCQYLAIGHHEPRAALFAFHRLARHDLGLDHSDVCNQFLPLAEAEPAVVHRWAQFTTHSELDWWCDWTATEASRGLIPVTVYDIS